MKGFRNLRVGAIGARPAAFNTVRYSEKILESQGISIETLDLSEVLGRIDRMKDNDDHAQAKLAAIKKYVDASQRARACSYKDGEVRGSGRPVDGSGRSHHQRGAVLDFIEENLGVVPCTVMSMMSNELLSSACEVDICGVLGCTRCNWPPARLRLFSIGTIITGSDPNKAVCFHCSNLPKHFFRSVKMDFQEIIAGTVGKENTFGTCVGLIKPEKMSFARFSTDDTSGKMRGYVGEGRFTDDPLNTFGGAGVVEIPNLQKLLRFICERGFEHHVAANLSSVASAVYEASTRYLGWDMYDHSCDNGAC